MINFQIIQAKKRARPGIQEGSLFFLLPTESGQTTIHAATHHDTHHVHAIHFIVLFQFMRVHRAQTLPSRRQHVKLT